MVRVRSGFEFPFDAAAVREETAQVDDRVLHCQWFVGDGEGW